MEHLGLTATIIFLMTQLSIIKSCNSPCQCERVDDNLSVRCLTMQQLRAEDIVCCNDTEGIVEDIYHLSTVGSDLRSFDMEIIRNMSNLHTLNMSMSNLSDISWSDFVPPSLKVLDVSNNRLENSSKGFFYPRRDFKVVALHGNRWECDLLFWFIDWVRIAQSNGTHFPNKDELFCFYGQHSATKKKAKIWELVESCPENCSCNLIRKDPFGIQVDCKGRILTDFPSSVPKHTKVLHLENNRITSFHQFRNVSIYQNISALYLDNNSISSLAELEGIKRYHVLSTLQLSGNKLTHLPIYIVQQMDSYSLSLGGNPWQCDCRSGTALRNFIIDQLKRIDDFSNITCAPDDERHANRVILHLSQTDLCYKEETRFHILDVVNGILILLIVVVLTKLLYDWWHFKHTGQLPLGPIAIVQLWKKKRFRLNSMET